MPKQPTPPCFRLLLVLLGNPARRGARLAEGAAAKPPPMLLGVGLVVQGALVFTVIAVRFSNGERSCVAGTARCYFSMLCISIRWDSLVCFCSTQTWEESRSNPSGEFFLTTLCSGAPLPFKSLVARGFHLEKIAAELFDSNLVWGAGVGPIEFLQSGMVPDFFRIENRR